MYLGSAQNNVANTSHFFPEFFGGIIDMKNKKRKKMSPQRGQKRDLMNIAELVIKKKKGGILFCVVVLFYFSISRIMELVSYTYKGPSFFFF